MTNLMNLVDERENLLKNENMKIHQVIVEMTVNAGKIIGIVVDELKKFREFYKKCWDCFSKRTKNDEPGGNESEDEESSDEDDSNSGDLSKYQLFESESDTEKKPSDQKKSAETTSSRSRRSRSK